MRRKYSLLAHVTNSVGSQANAPHVLHPGWWESVLIFVLPPLISSFDRNRLHMCGTYFHDLYL
mgnify:CR=1 FL=1